MRPPYGWQAFRPKPVEHGTAPAAVGTFHRLRRLRRVIVGVGVDLVDVVRFTAVLARTPAVRDRLFTAAERDLPPTRLAGRFAAKEAVAKALGGPAGLGWQDVEVVVKESGQPRLAVGGAVAAAAERRGVRRWHLSMSHDGGFAVAMVVAES